MNAFMRGKKIPAAEDEVHDVDERIHEREEDSHRRMDVLTTLDFHDFRRTSAKTDISSDLVNRKLSTGK